MKLSVAPAAAAVAFAAWAAGGCSPGDSEGAGPADSGPAVEAQASPLAGQCAPDNGSITLPEGFCAIVFHEGVGAARHIDVRDDGTVFVALRNRRSSRGGAVEAGGVMVLQDSDGDGRADTEQMWGVNGGNEVLVDGESVYFAPDDAVLRYGVPAGSLTPTSGPDTLVSGLPATRNHTAKSVALGPDGGLYVNIGAPSNACMEQSRTAGSPGMDPCPELETRGGVWRFDASATGQVQADGQRFATGLRNVVALRTHPVSGRLYGVQHGRDQLHGMFPELYTVEENAEKPAEEFVQMNRGDDFGWPYCYYDQEVEQKLLAPEYGGDGTEVGRCAEMKDPIIGFPGHWAPNDLEFYTGTQFPARFRGGAFIAFHGSWNRAPLPQAGYNVVFVRFDGNRPTSEWEVFADGFRPDDPSQASRDDFFRPVGLAVGPDGSLYVSDSRNGRIWRVVYRGA